MKKGEDKDISVMKQVSKMVETEVTLKYPDGSILFTGKHKKGEKPVTVSCAWYRKYGKPGENVISNPPEWQNIPWDEALKISEMFGDSLCLNLVEARRP